MRARAARYSLSPPRAPLHPADVAAVWVRGGSTMRPLGGMRHTDARQPTQQLWEWVGDGCEPRERGYGIVRRRQTAPPPCPMKNTVWHIQMRHAQVVFPASSCGRRGHAGGEQGWVQERSAGVHGPALHAQPPPRRHRTTSTWEKHSVHAPGTPAARSSGARARPDEGPCASTSRKGRGMRYSLHLRGDHFQGAAVWPNDV